MALSKNHTQRKVIRPYLTLDTMERCSSFCNSSILLFSASDWEDVRRFNQREDILYFRCLVKVLQNDFILVQFTGISVSHFRLMMGDRYGCPRRSLRSWGSRSTRSRWGLRNFSNLFSTLFVLICFDFRAGTFLADFSVAAYWQFVWQMTIWQFYVDEMIIFLVYSWKWKH